MFKIGNEFGSDEVKTDNHGALSFWEKLGFVKINTVDGLVVYKYCFIEN